MTATTANAATAAATAPAKAQPKAKPKTRKSSTKKQPAAVETSASIEEQTRAFLQSGNKIQEIQTGMSGQPSMAKNKHISLGNKTS